MLAYWKEAGLNLSLPYDPYGLWDYLSVLECVKKSWPIRSDDFCLSCVPLMQIFWNESGQLVCIATEESFFILRYNADAVEAAKENTESVTEDGIEAAFDVSHAAAF